MHNLYNYLIGKNLRGVDKVHFFITLFVRISIIAAIFGAIVRFNWIVLFISLIVFTLTFLPYLFERKYRINLPAEFEILVVMFIYGTLFLGEIKKYYVKYWWWDVVLHAGSAIVIGLIGFIILFIMYKGNKIRANPSVIAMFSFLFSVGIGALWEIFEFSIDQLLGLNMQKSGLLDTMWDLIVDSVGALIAAIAGYFYLKGKEGFFIDDVIGGFVRENPDFFNK